MAWLSKRPASPIGCHRKRNGSAPAGRGRRPRFSVGDDITPTTANLSVRAFERTSRVGAYPPNPWGLHDMHGNVWEWVEDDLARKLTRARRMDGSAWKEREQPRNPRLGVLRGGSWYLRFEPYCRSALSRQESTLATTGQPYRVPGGPNTFLTHKRMTSLGVHRRARGFREADDRLAHLRILRRARPPRLPMK